MIKIPCEKVVCNRCKELKQGGAYYFDDQNTTNLVRHTAICDDCFEELNPDMEHVQKLLNEMN
jgi:hypothetical protein